MEITGIRVAETIPDPKISSCKLKTDDSLKEMFDQPY